MLFLAPQLGISDDWDASQEQWARAKKRRTETEDSGIDVLGAHALHMRLPARPEAGERADGDDAREGSGDSAHSDAAEQLGGNLLGHGLTLSSVPGMPQLGLNGLDDGLGLLSWSELGLDPPAKRSRFKTAPSSFSTELLGNASLGMTLFPSGDVRSFLGAPIEGQTESPVLHGSPASEPAGTPQGLLATPPPSGGAEGDPRLASQDAAWWAQTFGLGNANGSLGLGSRLDASWLKLLPHMGEDAGVDPGAITAFTGAGIPSQVASVAPPGMVSEMLMGMPNGFQMGPDGADAGLGGRRGSLRNRTRSSRPTVETAPLSGALTGMGTRAASLPLTPRKTPRLGSDAEDESGSREDDSRRNDPRPQDPRFKGDIYTPSYVRKYFRRKEGLCPHCPEEKWLQLKNSAFWYHLQFYHGIAATTGTYFASPARVRLVAPAMADSKLARRKLELITSFGVLATDLPTLEGFCHSCRDWIPLMNNRRQGSLPLVPPADWERVDSVQFLPEKIALPNAGFSDDGGVDWDDVFGKDNLVTQSLFAVFGGGSIGEMACPEFLLREIINVIRSYGRTVIWYKHAHKCHVVKKKIAARQIIRSFIEGSGDE